MIFLIFFIYQFLNIMVLNVYILDLILAFGIFNEHNTNFIIFI